MTIRRHKREDSSARDAAVHGINGVNGANGVNGRANGHVANGDGHEAEAKSNGVMNGKKVDGEMKEAKEKVEKVVVDWEIPRKALHSSIGFMTIYLYTSHGSPDKVVIALSAALAALVPIDILRLKVPWAERVFEKCVGLFMRESEKNSSNGVIWYLLGADLCLLALPLDLAVVSILILSWADTAASTIGRLWGRYTKALPQRTPVLRLPLAPRKSRAGFAAACVTGGVIAVGFWGWLAPASGRLGASWTFENGVGEYFRASQVSAVAAAGEKVREALGGGVSTGGWVGLVVIGVVAGLVSGVAEALDLGSWDDNLTLPVIAGSCLWIFLRVFGLASS